MTLTGSHSTTHPPHCLSNQIQDAIRYPYIPLTEQLVLDVIEDLEIIPVSGSISNTLLPGLEDDSSSDLLENFIQGCQLVAKAEVDTRMTDAQHLHQCFEDGRYERARLKTQASKATDFQPLSPGRQALSRKALRETPKVFGPSKGRKRRTPARLEHLVRDDSGFQVLSPLRIDKYLGTLVTVDDAL
ncbi:hypothetical protein BD324DRAFT_254052 [Kockovaella imperatae]|uniref:Uncharacterized protein n=1 Tax=Kockovaella imperatae TaxID=4999 RepID=A0A1Y1URI6_9TREE|nr:hypothetical protein BD324DRAFT_254052 [Kockovaella imperatae]ORX40056.1 hypothetical protein BD324DRAFT_254052 [Kockovaella imperatae]